MNSMADTKQIYARDTINYGGIWEEFYKYITFYKTVLMRVSGTSVSPIWL